VCMQNGCMKRNKSSSDQPEPSFKEPLKRSRPEDDEDISQLKRSRQEEDDEDMDRLSSDPTYNVPQLTRYLKRTRFLDPGLGVREIQQSRDPMLIVLYNPNKSITLPDGTRTTVIDDLLDSADEQCARAYGRLYSDFELIQYNKRVLRASKDTHAKQVYYLCVMAIDEGLQDQFRSLYPQGDEVRRLDPFIKAIKAQMDETLNTAYVNVPRPSVYNVDTLTANFLTACAWAYPG